MNLCVVRYFEVASIQLPCIIEDFSGTLHEKAVRATSPSGLGTMAGLPLVRSTQAYNAVRSNAAFSPLAKLIASP